MHILKTRIHLTRHRPAPATGLQSVYVLSYFLAEDTEGPSMRRIIQVFTPAAAALFVATGVGLFFYFRNEKEKLLEQRRAYSLL